MDCAPGERDAFAELWATTLTATGYVALDRPVLVERVGAHTQTLLAALAADDFDPAPVARVGAALVDLGLTSPETLAGSLRFLGERLPLLMGPQRATRLPRLLSAFAAGFTTAMQQRIFRDQEEIRLRQIGRGFLGAPRLELYRPDLKAQFT